MIKERDIVEKNKKNMGQYPNSMNLTDSKNEICWLNFHYEFDHYSDVNNDNDYNHVNYVSTDSRGYSFKLG